MTDDGPAIARDAGDIEWRIPPAGETEHFGGDVLVRAEAYRAAGGYDATIVAPEDHELSARIRRAGYRIRRLVADMTWHDARMTRFGQWWRRGVRLGVGQAQVWARHRGRRQRSAIARAALWGGVVPIVAVAAARPTGGWSLILFALYPLPALRIAARFARGEGEMGSSLAWGAHCVGLSFPSLVGVLTFALRRGRGQEIIEYRAPAPPPQPALPPPPGP